MIRKFYRYIISYIYPVRCPGCDCIIEHKLTMCPACRSDLSEYVCDRYGNPDGYNNIHSCCEYRDVAKIMLHKLKFDNDILSAYAMGEIMADTLVRKGMSDCIDVIIPVPMTKSAKKIRGYNQCVWLVKEIAHALDMP